MSTQNKAVEAQDAPEKPFWGWARVDVMHSVHVIPSQKGHEFNALNSEFVCPCEPELREFDQYGRKVWLHHIWQ